MTKNLEYRVMAFVRSIADKCRSCNYRNADNCRDCPSTWAKSVLLDYNSENKTDIKDYSIQARTQAILAQLMHADRPLFAHEIDLEGLCSKQLKHWTLMTLLKTGKIKRILHSSDANNIIYKYTTTTPKG